MPCSPLSPLSEPLAVPVPECYEPWKASTFCPTPLVGFPKGSSYLGLLGQSCWPSFCREVLLPAMECLQVGGWHQWVLGTGLWLLRLLLSLFFSFRSCLGDPVPVSVFCLLCQGYGDHKPKSSTAAQEVKTLDGVFTEQVSEVSERKARGDPRSTPATKLQKSECMVS